jgi:type IV pilus assembly protein PilY1
VQGQLGASKGNLLVRLKQAAQPTGLLQEFGNRIRVGAMKFNFAGAASESSTTFGAAITTPKVCSNDEEKLCVMDGDCGVGNTCGYTTAGTTNKDGSALIYKVGRGKCSTVVSPTVLCTTAADCTSTQRCYTGRCWTPSATECTTDRNCLSSQTCISDGPGDHVTSESLIDEINSVRANAWTPFAEAYYNAIGYFATVKQCSNSTTQCYADSDCSGGGVCDKVLESRTTLRINTNDYDGNYNPSQYRCQQNYVLLISDGSSTADRNASASSLADLYHVSAGKPVSWDSTCANYAGSKNLPILSWAARHLDISKFSLATTPTVTVCSGNTNQICAADYDCPSGQTCLNIPRNGRDNISTYVVYNGGANGLAGECSSRQLLADTAANGGSQLKVATNPAELSKALRKVFEELAAKAASGTAASILSNSEGSGANILQAVFYPRKIFNNETSANWVGEMQNLWYYVDPRINNSTIREDTDGDRTLHLINDYVATFIFDTSTNQTMVQLQQDTNGDGLPNGVPVTVDPDAVKSIWRAGKQMWLRDLTLSPRTLYTPLLAGGVEVGSSGLMQFTYGNIGATTFPDNSAVLQPYMQMSDTTSAAKIMKYIHGFDFPGDSTMRNRTVKIGNIPAEHVGDDPTDPFVTNPRDKGIGVWKLGDIISSTPRIQSTGRLNSYDTRLPGGYNDTSYASFIKSNEYLHRGMVYVGANDGMLHAFKLGILDVTASDLTKATLTNPGGIALGEEQWAFIPKNALPYLKYTSDPDYSHIYFVDGSTIVLDASIGAYTSGTGSCTEATYDQCLKNPIVVNTATNNLDPAKNTWRTVLVGGMGLGGASSKTSCTGLDCVQTPITDPADTVTNPGLGYSAYYALDVTDPVNPKFMWEFKGDPANNDNLGYATSGPAIVRIGPANANGKWFAVFGSGPTGPIDTGTHQFMGRSNQNLKFFVVDLKTGELVRTIDTGIANAFSGSLVGSPIDTDRWNALAGGRYQDDAIYVGYTKKATSGEWTGGGVLRIMTKESSPADWEVSHVISASDNIGPVATAIARLQDRNNRDLWLFFGTGRYYYRSGTDIDDYTSQRTLYGVKEPCYNTNDNPGNFLDNTCNAARSASDITDQSTTLHEGPQPIGWKINLDTSTTAFGAERVVTDTVALTNGAVFFTSFKPTADACGFGGNSYLWALDYNSGLRPPDSTLKGKALIQLSTGEFKEVDLSTAFTDRDNRRMGSAMTGKPPGDAPPILSTSANKPIKRILHIQER